MSFLFGQTGGAAAQPTPLHFLKISDSQIGVLIPVLYGRGRLATHMIWWGQFLATLHKGGGKGLTGASTGQFYTYTASMAMALCLGPIQSVGRSFRSDMAGLNRLPAKTVNKRWTVFTGQQGQAAWSHLTTNFPGQDIGYTGIAYVAQANAILGTSGQLPQHTFEVFGQFPFSRTVFDANPADVIPDMIVNQQYGMSPGASWIADLTDLRTYCAANNFLISGAIDQQKPGREWLALIIELLHVEAVWSEGQLRIVPYATQPVTGNGVTWTPNLTPVCNFTDDDYITKAGEPPVQIKSSDPVKRTNIIPVEYTDTSNDYNLGRIEVMDESDMLLLGIRRDVARQYHPIPNAAMAHAVGLLKLQWQLFVTRKYLFKAPPTKAAVLDPMDPITISDTLQGIQNLPVRVVSIEETGPDNGQGYELTITCEDVGPDSTPGYLYNQPGGGAPHTNPQSQPADVNSPIIFEPNFLFNDPYQIWVGLSGQDQNENWGGANVWLSIDGGNSYAKVATATNPATMGALLATLPVGPDPDITDTLSIDLSESVGVLTALSSSETDQGFNLAYVDGELIAFANVSTLATPNQYNLTYLRRGVYGSKISSHAVGASFLYLGSVRYPDQGATVVAYPQNMVGKTISLKFTSFNTLQGGEQDLSDVQAWQYTIRGPIVRQIPPTNAWSANTQFPSGSFINANGYAFEALIGGVSGGNPPSFPNDFSATITDGSVLWQNIGPSVAIDQNSIQGGEFTANGLVIDWTDPVFNVGGWIDVVNQELGPTNNIGQFIVSQTIFQGGFELSCSWYSSGQLDFVAPAGVTQAGTLFAATYPAMPLEFANPLGGVIDGYLFRFDPTQGNGPCQIYRLDKGVSTNIGKNQKGANTNTLPPKWHVVSIIYHNDTAGTISMSMDGVLQTVATDSKFILNGPIGYAYGEGSSPTRFRNAVILGKNQSLDMLPDGSNRAIPKISHFNIAAQFTLAVPTWAQHLILYIYAAGGGGCAPTGGSGFAGGAGAATYAYVDVTPGQQISVAVGGGGAVGLNGNDGGAGGASTVAIGSLLFAAPGGGGGALGVINRAGLGGTTTSPPEYAIFSPGVNGVGSIPGGGPGGKGGKGGTAPTSGDDGKVVIIPSA